MERIRILLIDDNPDHFQLIKNTIENRLSICSDKKGNNASWRFLLDKEDNLDFIAAFNHLYRNPNPEKEKKVFFDEKMKEWEAYCPDMAFIDVNWGMTDGDENGICFVQDFLKKTIKMQPAQVAYLSIVDEDKLGQRRDGYDFIEKEIRNENGDIIESLGKNFSIRLKTKTAFMHGNLENINRNKTTEVKLPSMKK